MSLLNKTHVKRRALQYSEEMRNGKFTRVSAEFLADLERLVDRTIQSKVHTHPSKGKTLMGGQ
jgi:hypothetical protein